MLLRYLKRQCSPAGCTTSCQLVPPLSPLPPALKHSHVHVPTHKRECVALARGYTDANAHLSLAA